MTEFTDLNRRFHKASDKNNPEESAQQSYLIEDLLGREGSLGWPELLQYPVTVILGEPGSGKTIELRFQVEKFRRQSKKAFFVPLDRLVKESLITVLPERDQPDFQAWKKGSQKAYFFFDSVDESKLRKPDDFLTALQRISDAIDIQELQRACLIFSSRISEWRPVTDIQALQRLFPIANQTKKIERDQKQDDRSFLEQNNNGYEVKQQKVIEANEITPLVVQILPLDTERVRLYAQWRGLTDAADFIQALDVHHAWEFARRPLDVHGLIEFWRSHGRLGSLTELIEHSVTLSLRESEGRETLDPLTPVTARQGAEALAAATLLCRNLNIKVPDDAYVSVGTAGLDSSSCLPPTWSPTERRAILTRSLFDGATYGCIRFHHRRTMEFLTASWLSERMRDGCPQDHLDDLIFALHQGEHILRPTLAPVASWLANGNEPHNIQIRERLLQSGADVHLKYGDPEQLPIEYKKRILNTLSSLNENRGESWTDTDPEALARLSDPALAADISSLIRNRQLADSLRSDMLSLVRHGHLTECLETALEIIADPAETENIKFYAVAAIRDCGNFEVRKRLAAIVDTYQNIPNGLNSMFCETLYPEAIDANGLADLLLKNETSSEHSFDHSWKLKYHLREKLTTNVAGSLLDALMRLLRTAPYLEDGREDGLISKRFHWLCDVLPVVLIKLLDKIHLKSDEARLSVEIIRILEEDWTYGGHIDQEEVNHFIASIKRHPIFKSEYFWQGVEHYRSTRDREPDWFPHVTGFRNIVQIDTEDIVWLIEAVSTRQSAADRSLALCFAFELWRPYSMTWKPWFNLLGITVKQPELRVLFFRYSWKRLTFPMRASWHRNIKQKLLDRHWWTRKGYKLRHAHNQIRELYLLHRHLNRLYSGSAAHWLSKLSYEANREHKSAHWAADDWSSLRRKRGALVAWATRHGCEATWLKHTPLLPYEKPNPNQTSSLTVVGLCGLQSLWHRGKLDFATLSETDAIRAARYAMNELNEFSDWLPELAIAKPQAVRDVLIECMSGEWQILPSREHVSEILHKLAWQGERYWPLITDSLLSHLQHQDPQHSQILNYAVTILLKSPNPPYLQLIELASHRIVDYQPESHFFIIWMALWLQLEAQGAMDYLISCMNELSAPDADNLIFRLCISLRGERINSAPLILSPDFLQPKIMKTFAPLLYRHLRPSEDTVHRSGEAYTVTEQDHAQEYRNGLLQRLSQLEHPETLTTLEALRDAPELLEHRDGLTRLIEQHVLRKIDLTPWQPEDIRSFTSDFETDPHNDSDLFHIAGWRLQDIKREVERSENSLRGEVHKDWDEAELRRWFQRKLNVRAGKRYTIPQEAEIDQSQKPDLRFENPQIPSAVPVELKWADNCTVAELLERLENQLVGQYLRAHNVRYGIYLLGYIGRKQKWHHPTEQRMINFNELVNIIEQRAPELEQTRPDVAGIRVVAINFTILP